MAVCSLVDRLFLPSYFIFSVVHYQSHIYGYYSAQYSRCIRERDALIGESCNKWRSGKLLHQHGIEPAICCSETNAHNRHVLVREMYSWIPLKD